MKTFTPIIAAVVLVIPGLTTPAPAHAGDWGGLFSFVTLASEYRYQGVSNSDGDAVVQGNLHYWRPDGWYAGIFATQVNLKDPGHTSYELDYYAGKNLEFDGGRTELKLQALYTAFPDNKTFGPTYDFLTTQAGVKHVAGKLTTNVLAAFVPQGVYRSGKFWRAEAEADYALAPRLTLKALAGTEWGGRGHDRTYWSLGAASRWKALGFELRYVGSDRTRATCGFVPKACDPAIVGALTMTLPPIL